MGLNEKLERLDERQQRSPRLSFVAAVYKKFTDDQAASLAALIAYWGFVSLFPLLLVLVTVLGFVLQGDPSEKEKILKGTLGQFPLVSDQITHSGLKGSVAGLAIGVARIAVLLKIADGAKPPANLGLIDGPAILFARA